MKMHLLLLQDYKDIRNDQDISFFLFELYGIYTIFSIDGIQFSILLKLKVTKNNF